MNIQVDQFSSSIQKLLQEYGDQVRDLVDEIIPETGKEAKKQVKQESPQRTGAYARSWAVQNKKSRLGVTSEVHNKEKYRLTHLLEYGHIAANGRRVGARPHIAKVNEWAVNELFRRLTTALESGRTL